MSKLRLTVYNVGDGDCILIEFADGRLGLVDSCVPSWLKSSPALEKIRAKGELEFLCLTHPHLDHFTGMLQILKDEKIKVKQFWDTQSDIQTAMEFHNTGFAEDGPVGAIAKKIHEDQNKELIGIYRRVNELYGLEHIQRVRMVEFRLLANISGVQIQSLSPSDRLSRDYVKRMLSYMESGKRLDEAIANSISGVLLLRAGDLSVLLGADAPMKVWQRILFAAGQLNQLAIIRSRVFKVSHHGARDQHLNDLLQAIEPPSPDRFALLSCGSATHPSGETLDKLKAAKWRIFKTGFRRPKPTNRRRAVGYTHPAMAHPATVALFDSVSSSPAGSPCCGDIRVEIDLATQSIAVTPQHTPTCGYCG